MAFSIQKKGNHISTDNKKMGSRDALPPYGQNGSDVELNTHNYGTTNCNWYF
jgi:hypothetical protein